MSKRLLMRYARKIADAGAHEVCYLSPSEYVCVVRALHNHATVKQAECRALSQSDYKHEWTIAGEPAIGTVRLRIDPDLPRGRMRHASVFRADGFA